LFSTDPDKTRSRQENGSVLIAFGSAGRTENSWGATVSEIKCNCTAKPTGQFAVAIHGVPGHFVHFLPDCDLRPLIEWRAVLEIAAMSCEVSAHRTIWQFATKIKRNWSIFKNSKNGKAPKKWNM